PPPAGAGSGRPSAPAPRRRPPPAARAAAARRPPPPAAPPPPPPAGGGAPPPRARAHGGGADLARAAEPIAQQRRPALAERRPRARLAPSVEDLLASHPTHRAMHSSAAASVRLGDR